MNKTVGLVVAMLFMGGVLAAYFWWQQPETPAETPIAPPASVPADPDKPAQSDAPQYPIESVAPEQPTEPPPAPEKVDDSLEAALIDLLGSESVATFLRMTDIPQRAVATVDNLARSHATPKAWPVQPIPGRFGAAGEPGEQTIADANSARYEPFVNALTAVDTGRAVALYKKHYPVFQRAYEQQGFPDAHFNDRLVAVIDSLLATPEPDGPLRVQLTELHTEEARIRPWVHYRYVDPELEALPAGQKMMLRMGAENRKALKEKLRDVRRHLASGAERRP